MSRERRVHERISTRLHARVVREGDSIEGVVENVGRGGVLFSTDTLEGHVADGDEVEVEFEGRRAGSPVAFRVRGTVLRAERLFDGTSVVRSFAVQFAETIDLDGVSWS